MELRIRFPHGAQQVIAMEIQEQVSLAPLTTFQLGGPARYFVRVKSIDELREACAFAREHALDLFILGGGSNLLVRDAGFDGLVIKIELQGVTIEGAGDTKIIITYAGEQWDALVARAVQEGAWGVENLSGIPGTVGGAVVQNIGAYGAALSQTLLWVEAYDIEHDNVVRFTNAECQFGYRQSVFSSSAKALRSGEMNGSPTPPRKAFATASYVVVRAAFRLSPLAITNITYKDLAMRFADTTPTLQTVRAAVLDIRARKFPDLTHEGTAGSFFKNPIVSPNEAAQLQKKYPEVPVFAMPETSGIKIPLAWLLDHVLNMRGVHVGGARLYERQLLVIAAANPCDHASTASDVEQLAQLVKEKMTKELGFEIEAEVKII